MAAVASARFRWALAASFLALALALAVDPPGGRSNWLLGNVPTLVAAIAFGWVFARHPLSRGSSALMWLFLVLHEVGTSYGYQVPWGPVGGAGRNQYDRLVHLSFGLLLALPLRELLARLGKAAGRWADLLAILLVLAFAALYEVFEWVGAELVWSGPVEEILGFQGDALDGTKDMALALAGAALAVGARIVWERLGRPAQSTR